MTDDIPGEIKTGHLMKGSLVLPLYTNLLGTSVNDM
jgi:hypothetical protein